MRVQFRRFLSVTAFLIIAGGLITPQDISNAPMIRVNVSPEEAYIFVDGYPIVHRSNTLNILPGEHTIGVYNYGYTPQVRNVFIEKDSSQTLNARLKPVAAMVKGPWGRIQIEGVNGDDLVMLNGTSPEFFVGHVDEMNNDIWMKQMLVVPVGTHQLFIINPKTNKPIWSGPVEVKENKRVIVYTNRGAHGQMVYKNWGDGAKVAQLKRFEAGTATATIAVAPVVAKFEADKTTINCGDPVHLKWGSNDAAHTKVVADDQVLSEQVNGDLAVQPTKTTTYQFSSVGPGGTVTGKQTVTVNNEVKTSLQPSANEIRFVKVGDKITEQESARLHWTAENADAVHLEPVGVVNGNSGTETVTASTEQQTEGPVNESRTFRLTATNPCGGSNTSEATIHVVGSVQPEQVAKALPPELPQTASPLPVFALLGALFLGVSVTLRWVVKLP